MPASVRSDTSDKDSRLDLIGVQVYTRLMVEWLHAMTLLSLESAILPIPYLLRIYIGCLHAFYLFLSWLKASMFLNQIICFHAYLFTSFAWFHDD